MGCQLRTRASDQHVRRAAASEASNRSSNNNYHTIPLAAPPQAEDLLRCLAAAEDPQSIDVIDAVYTRRSILTVHR
jgi:hypothetical protein